ncbi:hypothetical protein SODALDRAFT_362058 [Sodiomyces alkalinus F11]|uniref:Uncharacterized protein n=1 Tax=Sodiomyces alkalinus (strain CBS 110278 / VKM F-3762 / F11) TaxID=1314773 RepID=A0A3N2PP21_SODAK|nr:hypothetical protein SODALDRAFT_362058 [Sodiomyces alkalinus F11]ROT36271.1 hypothetical protein SODALDRAFT_362058 [Sodiomyces alkalinus F11]
MSVSNDWVGHTAFGRCSWVVACCPGAGDGFTAPGFQTQHNPSHWVSPELRQPQNTSIDQLCVETKTTSSRASMKNTKVDQGTWDHLSTAIISWQYRRVSGEKAGGTLNQVEGLWAADISDDIQMACRYLQGRNEKYATAVPRGSFPLGLR